MTYLIILRLVADYFWSVKLLSVLHSAVGGWMLMRRVKVGLVGGFVISDLLVLLFTVSTVISYVLELEDNLIDFLKLLSITLFYFLGRFSRFDNLNYRKLANFSFFSLVLLLLLAIFGVGYVDWGAHSTFTGGYFFKTDLSLAVLVFLTFSISYYSTKSILVSIILLLISVWLVWVSNARISIGAITMVAGFLGWIRFRDSGFVAVLASFLLILMFVVAGMLYMGSNEDVLGFDFLDFWGEANLQGRNWIWLAVINYYQDYDLLQSIIGTGLSADVLATEKYSLAFGLENSRAHNSFLYLLVCMGGFGFTIFSSLLITWFIELLTAMKRSAEPILLVTVSLYVVFFVFSLTTEAVIRAQIMVPFSFFIGRLVLINRIEGVK